MKWLNKFNIPTKFTIVFVMAVYIPFLIAAFSAFNLTKKNELNLGLKTYSTMADLEEVGLRAELNRIKNELDILAGSAHIKNLLSLRAQKPDMNLDKFLNLPNSKDIFNNFEERLRLVMQSNPNLFGIAFSFLIKDYSNYRVFLAIDEDKVTHEISIKKNFDINADFLKEYEDQEKEVFHRSKSQIFPFNKNNSSPLDSIMLFRSNPRTNKNPYTISFYYNPYSRLKMVPKEDLLNLNKKFQIVLKEETAGNLSDLDTSAENTKEVEGFMQKLPKTFLNTDKGEFVDDNGNIYTIRKIKIGIGGLDKICLVAFYPISIIRGPALEARSLITKVLSLCSLIVIPFLFFSIRGITHNLRGLTKDLKITSSTLEKSTNEIQETSNIVKVSNNENKNSIDSILSVVEDIVKSNRILVLELEKKSEVSKETSTLASKGRDNLSKFAVSMDQIKESSKNISKILNIIENISTQTNILSMNATVEAARAGEHGKGFAVVAEAIRTLSKKTSASAEEIANLIQSSIDLSEKGSQNAEFNRANFKNIAENIENIDKFLEFAKELYKQRKITFENFMEKLKKIQFSSTKGTLQAEKASEIADKLKNEGDSLKKSIKKIRIMVEGIKRNKDTAS